MVYHSPTLVTKCLFASGDLPQSKNYCLWSDRCPCLAERTASVSGNDLERAFNTRQGASTPLLNHHPLPHQRRGRGWREKGSPTLCQMRLSRLLHHPLGSSPDRLRAAAGGRGRAAQPSEYDTSSICKQHCGRVLNYGHLHI